jgi:tRNA-specific 2-thiouridylase
MNRKKKVFVGLSGGVDSSVSAYLLKEEGYDVTGVFIKVWQPDFIPCTWREDRLDAMRVAAHLNIPFLTLDLEDTYKKEVIDYLLAEYKEGRTPNPDVFCNKYVKFGGFLDFAKKNGADFVATGHYAQNKLLGSSFQLLKSADDSKDQAYFLWTLRQDQLSNILFPVGGMHKSDVRKIAEKIKLPNAEKKDSQGLCFVSNVNMKDFLKHYLETKDGDVINENGEVIGNHSGAWFFTLGERHGFKITKKIGDKNGPYYVIKKDIEKNTITVSKTEPDEKGVSEISFTNENWISGTKPKNGMDLTAQIRYHGDFLPCIIKESSVTFKNPVLVASGQSIVFYDKNICLGGATIK